MASRKQGNRQPPAGLAGNSRGKLAPYARIVDGHNVETGPKIKRLPQGAVIDRRGYGVMIAHPLSTGP
jgi:hypothetical protein